MITPERLQELIAKFEKSDPNIARHFQRQLEQMLKERANEKEKA